jgi:hypothetical protein
MDKRVFPQNLLWPETKVKFEKKIMTFSELIYFNHDFHSLILRRQVISEMKVGSRTSVRFLHFVIHYL